VAGVATLLQFLFLLGAPGNLAFLLLALLHGAVGFWLITEPLQALVAVAVAHLRLAADSGGKQCTEAEEQYRAVLYTVQYTVSICM